MVPNHKFRRISSSKFICCMIVCPGILLYVQFVVLLNTRETVRDICTGKRVELSEEELDQSVQDNWK